MTPHQAGRAAFAAGVDRFDNPHPFASADFASWRNGWNAAQSAAVLARDPYATRQIGDHLPHGWETRRAG